MDNCTSQNAEESVPFKIIDCETTNRHMEVPALDESCELGAGVNRGRICNLLMTHSINRHMRTRVPTEINDAIRELCGNIVPGAEPLYVPTHTAAHAAENDCFNNVKRVIEQSGGETVHGWRIVEWPRAFLQAEFHGIWRKPDGQLLDVSIGLPNQKQTLFLLDPQRVFNSERIPNRKWALTTDMLVHEFMSATAEVEKMTGNHIGMNRVVMTRELRQLLMRLKQLFAHMDMNY